MVTFKSGEGGGGSSSRRSGSPRGGHRSALGAIDEEDVDVTEMEWVKRARERGKKEEKLERGANII